MPRRELSKQKDIVDMIRINGGLARLCVQTPYTIVGDPDVYAVWKGHMLQIEVKEPGEVPTDIQELRLAQWKSAGAKILRAYSVEEARDFLRKIK